MVWSADILLTADYYKYCWFYTTELRPTGTRSKRFFYSPYRIYVQQFIHEVSAVRQDHRTLTKADWEVLGARENVFSCALSYSFGRLEVYFLVVHAHLLGARQPLISLHILVKLGHVI